MTTDYIHTSLGNLKAAVATATAELSKAKDPIIRKVLEDSIAATTESHRILIEQITKTQVAELLKLRHPISEIFPLSPGQNCDIYKSRHFEVAINNPDIVVYIPDLSVYDLDVRKSYTSDEDIADVLCHCYSRADFEKECKNTDVSPSVLFNYVNWQNPSAALPELSETAC